MAVGAEELNGRHALERYAEHIFKALPGKKGYLYIRLLSYIDSPNAEENLAYGIRRCK
jgi:hypothetical protein